MDLTSVKTIIFILSWLAKQFTFWFSTSINKSMRPGTKNSQYYVAKKMFQCMNSIPVTWISHELLRLQVLIIPSPLPYYTFMQSLEKCVAVYPTAFHSPKMLHVIKIADAVMSSEMWAKTS